MNQNFFLTIAGANSSEKKSRHVVPKRRPSDPPSAQRARFGVSARAPATSSTPRNSCWQVVRPYPWPLHSIIPPGYFMCSPFAIFPLLYFMVVLATACPQVVFLFIWSWSGATIRTHINVLWKRSSITNIKTEGYLTQLNYYSLHSKMFVTFNFLRQLWLFILLKNKSYGKS
jgi:hypothetical protein